MGRSGLYRTVCVRLCDGYYWPVSFATSSGNFDRDEETCERSCSSPSRLYSYPNSGGEPEEMTDLKGVPYSNLKTAFLFRSEYKPECKCRPDPWEQEAVDKHRLYALEARQRKGDKRAAAEIAALKSEIAARQRSGSVKSVGSGGGMVQGSPQDQGATAPRVTGTSADMAAPQPASATSPELHDTRRPADLGDPPKTAR